MRTLCRNWCSGQERVTSLSSPVLFYSLFYFIFLLGTYFGLKIPRHVSKTLEERNLTEFGNGEGFANSLIVICAHLRYLIHLL